MAGSSAESQRLYSLDSLRGVAALVVVFHHCALALPGFREALYGSYVARPLIIGRSAVDLFFVLSGMVLYGTLGENDRFQYLPYLTKRLLRLYPPLCAAVLLSLTCYLIVQPHHVAAASYWFNNESWNRKPSFNLVAGQLLLWDPWRYSSFDNVTWSLVHEIRISLVFPLLVLALRARLSLTILTSFAIFVETSWVTNINYSNGIVDLTRTLHYVPLFAAGAFLMIKRESFARWFHARLHQFVGIGILITGIVLMCIEDSEACVSAGAILTVLACSIVPPVERLLCHRHLRALGQVSYSLYLTHLIVLLVLIHSLGGTLPIAALLVLTLLLAAVVAIVMFRMIEEPARIAGRRLSSRMTRTAAGIGRLDVAGDPATRPA